jgi:ppGpp synthetase/RelA/SpoT-type nucleotidyltranferase
MVLANDGSGIVPAAGAGESPPHFDFDNHRQRAVDVYAKVRDKYQDFAFVVRNVLREAIERRQLKVHSIEARAKSLDSFGSKAMRPSDEDPNLPKYQNPLREITDLAAVPRYYIFSTDHRGRRPQNSRAVPGPRAG